MTNADWSAKDNVLCSLRLPEQYLDVLRRIAQRHSTSNGGAVMLLVDALLREDPARAQHGLSLQEG